MKVLVCLVVLLGTASSVPVESSKEGVAADVGLSAPPASGVTPTEPTVPADVPKSSDVQAAPPVGVQTPSTESAPEATAEAKTPEAPQIQQVQIAYSTPVLSVPFSAGPDCRECFAPLVVFAAKAEGVASDILSKTPIMATLGAPVYTISEGTLVSFQSVNYPDRLLRHRNFELWLDPGDNNQLYRDDSAFFVRSGLAGQGTVSFESRNYPGRFLRHSGFQLFLHPRETADLFLKDSSFFIRSSNHKQAYTDRVLHLDVSLESINYPGRFLRHSSFRARIDPDDGNAIWRPDSTWSLAIRGDVDPSASVVNLPIDRMISFQSINYPDRLFRHRNFELWLDPSDNSQLYRDDSAFFVRSGLAGQGSVSFESKNYPGRFLRHSGFQLFLHPREWSDLYINDASFFPRPPIEAAPSGQYLMSFESKNYPGRFLRHSGFRGRIDPNDGQPVWRLDATWALVYL